MKCDNCKFYHFGFPTYHDPADDSHCTKGNWGGDPGGIEIQDEDPWKDCPDFEEKEILNKSKDWSKNYISRDEWEEFL